jgi:hypothetical protein
MRAKNLLLVMAAVMMLASIAVMPVGITMKAYAQNATTANLGPDQMTNSTNATGVASSTGENDYTGGVEEGQGEDEDEPGDVDKNDQED